MAANDGLLTFKYVDCVKTYEKKFDEDLLKRFQNTCKFCAGDIKKILSRVSKRSLTMWVWGWLRKIQWNVTTTKERILQQPDTGEYHSH